MIRSLNSSEQNLRLEVQVTDPLNANQTAQWNLIRRILVYAFEEEPEVLRVNSRRNPMPQIRDPRLCLLTALETLAHPLYLSFDRLLPAVQYVRIQVALERDVWTGGLPSNGRFDTPVQPDHIVTAGLSNVS